MCFSAEASFTASAILGIAGIYLGHKFWGDRRFLIAITPLLFALQQFAEGWLWVGLTHGLYPRLWSLFAEYLYLFFAYLLWPVWIPFAALSAEKDEKRKKWLKWVLIAGSILFVFNGIYLLSRPLIEAFIAGHSISYGYTMSLLAVIYAFVVVSPFFITSLPHMKGVGLLVALSFVIALTVYTYAFTSIWCFVAAVTTLLFLLVLKRDLP